MHTLLVGGLLNLANSLIALYLWNERRSERFLLFWSLAWMCGAIRWATSYFAAGNPELVPLLSLQSAVLHFLLVLGSYDLLPGKPWKRPLAVGLTAILILSYTLAGIAFGIPAQMEYARFFTVLLVWAACMLWAYRSERLPGYAFAAGTIGVWGTYVGVGLYVLGKDIAAHVVVPLFNVPVMFSIIVVAYQRSRRDLHENERTLRKIFDTAPTPIIIARPPRGELERANAAAVRNLGLPPDGLAGKTMSEHGLIMDPAARAEIYAELAAGRRVIGRIVEYQRPGDAPRTIAIHAESIFLDRGERYIFSFYDLTELRRAERAVAEAEERRRAAEVALQRERDEMAHAQRVTTLGELAVSLAHEIGQPLTAILANAQAARRLRENNPNDPEVGEAILDIANSAREAGDVIARLRSLFRKGETERALLDVNRLVDDVLRLVRNTLLHDDIHVVLELAGDLPPVQGDAVQLRQVLLNVIMNAREAIAAAAHGRREIHIRTRRTGSGCALALSDTGIGLAAAECERIFEHFVTNKPNGVGMGLAISRTIILAHDGRIWATAGADSGLTLNIELPAAGPEKASLAA